MNVSKVFVRTMWVMMLFCAAVSAQQKQADTPVLTGPYLGQTPPGLTPAVFAPGIISTEAHEFSCTMSPDGKEFYFTRQHPEMRNRVMVTRWEKSGWTKPEMAPKAGDDEGMEPFSSPDGKTLFYQSWRQIPDATTPSMDIWTIIRGDKGWSDPIHLGAPFNPGKAMYISMAANGTFYTTDISGGMGTGKIVTTRLKDNEYEPYTYLPPAINATGREIYPCIAPDESFLLFARINEERIPAIFVSFRQQDKTWGDPQKIELGLKTAVMPRLSPDGKYLFFTSVSEKTEGDIYWVDAAIMEALRPKR